MRNLKAKFRAWLIDLVREAIRIENRAEQYRINPPRHINPPRQGGLPIGEGKGVSHGKATYPGTPKTFANLIPDPNPIQLEPSFEQMQAEAIQAQTKFYEEVKK